MTNGHSPTIVTLNLFQGLLQHPCVPVEGGFDIPVGNVLEEMPN